MKREPTSFAVSFDVNLVLCPQVPQNMLLLCRSVATHSALEGLHFGMNGCVTLQPALAVCDKAALFAEQFKLWPVFVELHVLLEVFSVANLYLTFWARDHLSRVFIGVFALDVHFQVRLFISTDVVTHRTLDALLLHK